MAHGITCLPLPTLAASNKRWALHHRLDSVSCDVLGTSCSALVSCWHSSKSVTHTMQCCSEYFDGSQQKLHFTTLYSSPSSCVSGTYSASYGLSLLIAPTHRTLSNTCLHFHTFALCLTHNNSIQLTCTTIHHLSLCIDLP